MSPVPARARPHRKPAAAYHHGDLRASMIDAAVTIAGRDGVAAIQLRALARRLGVSPAAPFRHFADRAALLAAIAEVGFTLRAAALARHATPRAQAIAAVRFAVEEPGFFRVMSAPEVLADPRLAAALAADALPLPLRCAALGLATLLASGQLGEVSADGAARLAADVLGAGG
jgi:AcrR family transcriptional regulator